MNLTKTKKKFFGLIKTKETAEVKKTYFCGIQVRKKILTKYYSNEYKFIHSIYFNIGLTKELNEKLELIFQSYDICTNYDNEIWLIYLHSLIEQCREEDAKLFLNRYTYYFGKKDLDKILPVAKFSLDNGFQSEKINQNAKLYEHILKNPLTNEIFKDKKIAVVGNSGCEIGKNKGHEIDSHDIVIRFNSYPEEKKWEIDYGSKTNIWVQNLSIDYKPKNNIEKYDYVIQHSNVIHKKLWEQGLKILHDTYNRIGNKYYIVPEEIKFELAKYGIHRPTSGCTILWTLYKLLGSLKNVDVYGFSFLSKDYSDTKHYFDNICKIDINHDMKLEIDLLHKLYFEEEDK